MCLQDCRKGATVQKLGCQHAWSQEYPWVIHGCLVLFNYFQRLLVLPSVRPSVRTSTASSRCRWALPDLSRELQSSLAHLNRERQISVGTAGPQLRAPDLSGHCPLRSGACGWGPAVSCRRECQNRCKIECQNRCQKKECWNRCQKECQNECRIGCQNRMSEWMPDRMPKKCQMECQVECQNRCQKECQNRCQKECQNRCQKGCQIECQNRCQIECHNSMTEQTAR